MSYHITLSSSNQKTGPIPVTTSPRSTCPSTCPLRGNGCYAGSNPLALHWSAVSSGKRGTPWKQFLKSIESIPPGQLWRHNQAGDLPGIGNRINSNMLRDLVSAQSGSRGWTYTHKPVIPTKGVPSDVIRENRTAVRSAVRAGFAINLSGNSLQHADALARTGLPVATVVPSGSPARLQTPEGRTVVVCPAQRSDVTCSDCGLCAKSDRKVIIGFLPHGTGSRKVDEIAKGGCNVR